MTDKRTYLNYVERSLGVVIDNTFFTHHRAGKTVLATITCSFLAPKTQGIGETRGLETKELIEELWAVLHPLGEFRLQSANVGDVARK